MSDSSKLSSSAPSVFYSVRFVVALFMFLAVAIQYTHKTDISVGIICMINHTATNGSNQVESVYSKSNVSCYFQNTSKGKDPDGPFLWNKDLQELALAGYFYGYIVSQVPGGVLASKIGPKYVLFFAMLFGSIFTLLVPIAARWHYYAMFICRFLNGFSQGMMWPTMMVIYNYWIPLSERGRLVGLANAGSQFGTIVGFSLGGYLCVHGGWTSLFYYFGILGSIGIVWCFLWLLLTSNKPENHRFISEREKNYLIEETGHLTSQTIELKTAPWRKIFTSKSCIILYIIHFAFSWGLILFLTNVPTYLKEVLKFDIQSNGLLSAVPYALVVIVIISSGQISDKLLEKKIFERTTVRNIFNTFGMLASAAAIFALAYIKCDKPYLGVAMLTLGIAISGCLPGAGFMLQYNEVAGRYAGIMFGLSNSISQATGIIVPHFIAAVTKNKTQEEWATVFMVTAGILVIGAVIGVLFSSSKTEPWARKDEDETSIIGQRNAHYGAVNYANEVY